MCEVFDVQRWLFASLHWLANQSLYWLVFSLSQRTTLTRFHPRLRDQMDVLVRSEGDERVSGLVSYAASEKLVESEGDDWV